MEGHGLSQRRACRLVSIGHATLPYQRRRANDDAVRKRLRELAAQRRRFGYRRLGWLLAREGHAMNHKKLYRLYREERLMVRRRGGRKRALGSRTPMMVPAGINQRWSLDFVSDTLADGRRFRVRTGRLQPRVSGHRGGYFPGWHARGARVGVGGESPWLAPHHRQR